MLEQEKPLFALGLTGYTKYRTGLGLNIRQRGKPNVLGYCTLLCNYLVPPGRYRVSNQSCFVPNHKPLCEGGRLLHDLVQVEVAP